MPIYCYTCVKCGAKIEDLRRIGDHLTECVCGGGLERDYMAENPVFIPDIPAGFNWSIGLPYSGRRDLMTKMRASGHYSMANGGGVTMPDRTYYGESEYAEKILYPYDKSTEDAQFDEMVGRQLDAEAKGDLTIPVIDTDTGEVLVGGQNSEGVAGV